MLPTVLRAAACHDAKSNPGASCAARTLAQSQASIAELNFQSCKHDGRDHVDIVWVAANRECFVSQQATSQAQPAADGVLKAVMQLDVGIVIADTDGLVISKTSQRVLAKDLADEDTAHAGRDAGLPALPLRAAGGASSTTSAAAAA